MQKREDFDENKRKKRYINLIKSNQDIRMDIESFEEFKSHFLSGVEKISEKAMEACKKAYQRYLLMIEDDNYFEPLMDNDIHRKYVDKWLPRFDSSLVKETEIVILIMPSFEHPSLLKIEENEGVYNLYYRYLEKDYLPENYGNQELMKSSLRLKHINLASESTTKLWVIFNDTINKAQKPKSMTYTLDGVMFFIIRNINNDIQIVSKNLTDITTKTGKITNFLEELTTSILNDTFTISLKDFQQKIEEISILYS